MKKFYITTPLYYVNAKLHIGHTYTTVFCDTISRYKKSQGFEVFFLTGSDEHGQKIFEAAKKQGITPKQLADQNVDYFVKLWDKLNIDYDKFIRTTDKDHEERVEKILQKLYDKGYIYKANYETYHCIPCESFWNANQLKDGKCPSCGGDVVYEKEENYFFSISKFHDYIKEMLKEHPELIKPPLRYNEIMGKIDDSMDDKSVSRAKFDWGIPLPFDKTHVTYVWFDAILNYITGIGYPDNIELFNKFWPADLHVIGKDILWFHTLFWYSILKALDVEIPTVYAHGYWLIKGGKMSKRSGIVVDPFLLTDKYGVDPVRYFLVSELSEGQDTEFSEERLIEKFNNELVNTYSNAIHRTLTMSEKYIGGDFSKYEIKNEEMENKLIGQFAEMKKEYFKYMDNYNIFQALKSLMKFCRNINGYIDEAAPFRVAKEDLNRTATILHTILEGLRNITVMLYPVIPDTALKVLKADFHYENIDKIDFEKELNWGSLDKSKIYKKGEAIFSRIK